MFLAVLMRELRLCVVSRYRAAWLGNISIGHSLERQQQQLHCLGPGGLASLLFINICLISHELHTIIVGNGANYFC
jgi:hypothetical protein